MSHRTVHVLPVALCVALLFASFSARADEPPAERVETPVADAGLMLLIGGGLVSVASGTGAILIDSRLSSSIPSEERSALTVAGVASVALAAATGIAAITGGVLMMTGE